MVLVGFAGCGDTVVYPAPPEKPAPPGAEPSRATPAVSPSSAVGRRLKTKLGVLPNLRRLPEDDGEAPPPPPPPPEVDPCTAPPLEPDEYGLTLEHGGIEREFDLYLPDEYDARTPLPVVFYFHPLFTNKSYLKLARTRREANREGYIAVFPNGIGASWNAGACCGPANGAGDDPPVDDLGFVRAILDDLKTRVCMDERRVYATGFSNGGFLSHRLACQASDVFAAVAPVSSVNGMTPAACRPERPVPILTINGTEDILVPYEGGFSLRGITNGTFESVSASTERWRVHNGCVGEAQIIYDVGDTTCRAFEQCAEGSEVVECTVAGGGHCWFGEPICVFGDNAEDISATPTTWAFLSRFAL